MDLQPHQGIAMFRFTIRDVLWLTVVAAMALAWLIHHRHDTASRQQLMKENERLAAEIRQLQFDVRLANERAILSEAFKIEQVQRTEAQRQEAIAHLKARGFNLPKGIEDK